MSCTPEKFPPRVVTAPLRRKGSLGKTSLLSFILELLPCSSSKDPEEGQDGREWCGSVWCVAPSVSTSPDVLRREESVSLSRRRSSRGGPSPLPSPEVGVGGVTGRGPGPVGSEVFRGGRRTVGKSTLSVHSQAPIDGCYVLGGIPGVEERTTMGLRIMPGVVNLDSSGLEGPDSRVTVYRRLSVINPVDAPWFLVKFLRVDTP